MTDDAEGIEPAVAWIFPKSMRLPKNGKNFCFLQVISHFPCQAKYKRNDSQHSQNVNGMAFVLPYQKAKHPAYC